MKPLRVAMISHGYFPRVGGLERVLGALCPALQALDVDVHVLTRRFPGLPAYELIDRIPVHRLPIPGPKVTASLSFTATGLVTLARLRPQIIHAHEMFAAATTAVAAKQLLGTPVVITAHSSGIVVGDVRRLQRRFLGAQRLKLLAHQVDRFVAISQAIAAEFGAIGVPAGRCHLIPNGVDTRRFAPATDRPGIRARLGLPAAGPVVVFTGRLIAAKRVDALLALWPRVRTAHPAATLVIVGTGPEEARLRTLAGPGVVWAGAVDNVSPYLQAADLFVLPSSAEGLSVAMLEAMACGLPVLVTRVGGAADVITPEVNGWLIPPDDPAALQAALERLLSSVETREQVGQAARAHVLQQYALPVVAQRLREVYDSVMDSSTIGAA